MTTTATRDYRKEHRILWSKTERAKLVAAVERITAADPTASLNTIIAMAQSQVLPPERRRKHKHPAGVGRVNYHAFLDAFDRGIVATHKLADSRLDRPDEFKAPAKPAPAPVPAPEPEPEPEDVPTPETETEPDLVPIEAAHTLPTAALVGELMCRMGAALLERVDRGLDPIVHAFVAAISGAEAFRNGTASPRLPAVPLARREAPPKPPVVSVVGLFKDQFEHVKEKCKDLGFVLRWVDKDQATPSFPQTDYIVVQKHCAHRWYDAAQKMVPPDKLVFADGAQTNTVQRIFDFYSRRIAKAGVH